MTGISTLISAVLPGDISEQTGRAFAVDHHAERDAAGAFEGERGDGHLWVLGACLHMALEIDRIA